MTTPGTPHYSLHQWTPEELAAAKRSSDGRPFKIPMIPPAPKKYYGLPHFHLGQPRIFYRGGQWNCGGAIRGVGATPFDAYCGLLEKWMHPEDCLPARAKIFSDEAAKLRRRYLVIEFFKAAFLAALSVAVGVITLTVFSL